MPDLTLYCAISPNSYSVSVCLEELNVPYTAYRLDVAANEHKRDWFLEYSPTGKFPVLVDSSRSPAFAVFESSAILLYLAQHYDTQKRISFDPAAEPELYSEQLQWLFYAHGHIGANQGQMNHFHRYAPERIDYAITRFTNEVKNVYHVFEKRLSDRKFLVGERYTLVDIKAFTWIMVAEYGGLGLGDYPNLKKWIARIEERTATRKGLSVPGDIYIRDKLQQLLDAK